MTGFSVNANQSENKKRSDDESNCGPPPQKEKEKPSRNAVKICKASNDVLDKDINFLFLDAEKHE